MTDKCKSFAKNNVLNRITHILNCIKHVKKSEYVAMKIDTNQIICDSNQPCPNEG